MFRPLGKTLALSIGCVCNLRSLILLTLESYRFAGMQLVRKALAADQGYLLEPMMRLEVTTPEVVVLCLI